MLPIQQITVYWPRSSIDHFQTCIQIQNKQKYLICNITPKTLWLGNNVVYLPFYVLYLQRQLPVVRYAFVTWFVVSNIRCFPGFFMTLIFYLPRKSRNRHHYENWKFAVSFWKRHSWLDFKYLWVETNVSLATN